MPGDRVGPFRASLRKLGVTRGFALALALITATYAAILASSAVELSRPARFSLTLDVSVAGAVRIGWVKPGGMLWARGVRANDAVLALDGR